MKIEKWYSVKPSPPAMIEILANVRVNVINVGIMLLELFLINMKIVLPYNIIGIRSITLSIKFEVPLVPKIPCNSRYSSKK